MRFSVSLAAMALAVPGLANFHIGRADKETNPFNKNSPVISWTDYVACPSNYFGCKCYGGISATADRGVSTTRNKSPSGDSFSLNAGLCGMGKLDFYWRQNLQKWEFFGSNGDGKVKGECYPNSTHDLCFLRTGTAVTVNYYDKLVCYSYICGE
ncbi:hypothetical protein NQ176_g9271 [Zarea fungicola]|uniref:Uncharacterized protein n=1 Tax=Zarea fungicola TaxID=93591 RepID=A0ACC1MP05_9HYPO|nr:hypothetical protein NQ176_g9271 [Lecanicillium fungicola]